MPYSRDMCHTHTFYALLKGYVPCSYFGFALLKGCGPYSNILGCVKRLMNFRELGD